MSSDTARAELGRSACSQGYLFSRGRALCKVVRPYRLGDLRQRYSIDLPVSMWQRGGSVEERQRVMRSVVCDVVVEKVGFLSASTDIFARGVIVKCGGSPEITLRAPQFKRRYMSLLYPVRLLLFI